ncbi:MAG TPA: Na(+)/H(+) antiporter subunit C [Actinotalea sp.]
MTPAPPNLVLVAVIVVMVTVGVYLLLERSLSRVLLGIIALGNGVNLLFLVAGGRAGGAPIIGQTPVDKMSDPLPQAMVLTAIVITLGMTGFLLAVAYRSWQLHGHDEVQDDLEDRAVARRAASDLAAYLDADDDGTDTLDDEAAAVHDDMVHDEKLDGETAHAETAHAGAADDETLHDDPRHDDEAVAQ